MRRNLEQQREFQREMAAVEKKAGAGSWMTEEQSRVIQDHLQSPNVVLNSITFQTQRKDGCFNRPFEINFRTAYRPDLIWVIHYWTLDGHKWDMRIFPDGATQIFDIDKIIEEC